MFNQKIKQITTLLLLSLTLVSFNVLADRETTYFHTDALGSVIAASDESGDLLWRKQYAPFGEALPESDETERLAYTGKSYNKKTGLSYFGARHYDPVIGRFISNDPVGALSALEKNPMMFNRYAYANNNPYRYTDPNGESPIDIAFLAIDVGRFAIALYSGNPAAIQSAALDVGASVVGVASPVPGIGQAIKGARAGRKAAKALDRIAAKGTGKSVKEGIYEFTDTAGKKYCGQSCNIPNRLKSHVNSGKLDASQGVSKTEVLGGKTAREIAEHRRIQDITGGVPARFSDKVSNKVDPIGPKRSHLLND